MNESNFEDRVDLLKKTWISAEKKGLPRSETKKNWDMISLELEFSDKPMPELENVASCVLAWLNTKNPHYIDAAFLSCCDAEITPPPTLLRMMEEVCRARFLGIERGGTAKEIEHRGTLEEALRITCMLHLAGATVEIAASKAARFMADSGYTKIYKASTLEKKYRPAYRKGNPTLEQLSREGLEKAPEETRREWKRLLDELPEANDDLKGTAR